VKVKNRNARDSRCYPITKLIVVFSGDDWYGPLWQFSAEQLAWLAG